ncbi:hypothetical protein [Parvularcula dongshanensis]|uniref:Uncharacterized protein n=1 Tax=Parvularcula dongshanensis TaxID=1173995 RepID=A0A840I2L7_9PROT|nr:hypothetical protein [Parvularcula dongshanensis]MBB4658542.1 hypothetical protein [Parvularcula dongshanensis]
MGVKAGICGAIGLAAIVGFASAGEAVVPTASAQEASSLLERTASDYVFLRTDIDYIGSSPVKDAKGMREAHNRLASFDPEALARGWVAYAALVAADTPSFAEAIEQRTNKPKKREAFLKELRDNPAVVRNMEGSEEAIAAIRAVAARDATKINALGDKFIDDAYQMQAFGWAKQKIPANGSQRVASALAYAKTRAHPSMAVSTRAQTKAGTFRPNLAGDATWTPMWSVDTTPPSEADRTGVLMTKALVLAARYATNDLTAEHLDLYADNKTSDKCLVNAKLNLDQCIAATRTPYEEAFCLGEHALNDVSYCVGWVANAGRIKE